MTQDLPGQLPLPTMGDVQQPAEATPVPEVPPAAQTEAPEAVLTFGLLRDFQKQPGCEEYSKDGEMIKMLVDYIWVRQLTPSITFEQFLERFTPLADFNIENMKHPNDAVKGYCPRSKKAADSAGKSQWSAKEVVELLVLYVDMCREADATGVEPLSFLHFMAGCAEAYKTGEIAPPLKPEPKRGGGGGSRAPRAGEPASADPVSGIVETGNPQRPTGPNQRIIYERPSEGGRQLKGVTERVDTVEDRQYVTFRTDQGELVEGVNIMHCTVCAEPLPSIPANAIEVQKLWIPKNQIPAVEAALQLTTPMANMALNDSIHQWEQGFQYGLIAELTIINTEGGPTVDARLVDPSAPDETAVVFEIEPRRSLLGTYNFELPNDAGTLSLEVCSRK